MGIVLLLANVMPCSAELRQQRLPAAGLVHPHAVSAETKAELAKYSLAAYENTDPTNRVKALLFTPKQSVNCRKFRANSR